MKDVFEPSLSLNKTDVFEPMSNFVIPPTVLKVGTDLLGGLIGSGSKKA